MKKNLIIFASGSGSNAENTATFFKNHPRINITALFCNKPDAGVIHKMEKFGIPVILFDRKTFQDKDTFLQLIAPYQPDLIALLGFLWKIPNYLVQAYPGKIINLHPALLPKFGGKGMYGHFVHEAVVNTGEKESGITIHWVNENYDEGKIIAQFKCSVHEKDSAHDIANKIHELEQKHVPQIIEEILSAKVS